MYKFIVAPTEYSPQLTIRNFLRTKGISLTEWRRIKSVGLIMLNGYQLIEHMPYLKANDLLEISLPELNNINLAPEMGPLTILFEDEYLLAVSKPSGMLVHPTVDSSCGTLGNLIMGYYGQRGIGCGFKPIMRLDRNTSGIVVLAKSAQVQHLLSNSKIRKLYMALIPNPNFETIDVIKPIARKLPSIIEREVSETQGKYAHTFFSVVQRCGEIALVQAELFTGRTHQIRVHAAYMGYPLLGDDLYGGDTSIISRQALHAYKLIFTHPITGEQLTIIDELPKELKECLNLLK